MPRPGDKVHRDDFERVEGHDLDLEPRSEEPPAAAEPNSRVAARAAAARAERGGKAAEPERAEAERMPLPPLPAPAPRPGIFAGSWADEPDEPGGD